MKKQPMSLSRKLQKNAGQLIMDVSNNAVSPVARTLLGLSPKEPNIGGIAFEEASEDERFGKLYSMKNIPDEERKAELAKWHQEGWRADAAEKVVRQVYSLGNNLERGHVIDHLTWPIRKRLLWKELAEARTITWKAWHYAYPGETTAIDGQLILPSSKTLVFDVQALGDNTHWVEEEYRLSGGADIATGDSYCPGMLVAADVLTPALLLVALRGWYVQRFAWKRGHWAIMERKLPEFVIDAAWEEEDHACKGDICRTNPTQQKKYAREALKAEQKVLKLLSSKEAQDSYDLYNAQAIPEELVLSIKERKQKLKAQVL